VGNTIRNCTTDAIQASSSILVRWPKFYIRDNQMFGGVRFYRQEPMAALAATEVWIEDNKIYNCEQEAIRVMGGTTLALRSKAFIRGNYIENPTLGSTGQFAVRMNNVVDSVIDGNHIVGSATTLRGVYVDGANTTGTIVRGDNIVTGSGIIVAGVDVATGDFTINGESYINDVYDAPSLAAGASDIRQVTATGATAGDHLVAISHGIATDNLELSLVYFGTDFVRYRIKNVSAGVYDAPSTTYRIVWRKKYK
jgi:hypothetical protein